MRRLLTPLAAVALAFTSLVITASPSSAAVNLPPLRGGLDYQIGGAYTPASDVQIVIRDNAASPVSGKYNVCYINAFQVQPGEDGTWQSDLLLRDANGNKVVDPDWKETLLDLRTADKRTRVAAKVKTWIDSCAAKGFQAVEPDNYDSFSRSKNLLTTTHAQEYIKLLSSYAHGKNLAIAQKNTPELAGNRVANGLDFAVSEECGEWEECGDYAGPFNNRVLDIEYTNNGRSAACSEWSGKISIVQRDVQVKPAGTSGYVRKTC
ncbi:endo alpha-1,4 polygalactosaminidase [Umezawaea sp. Da 62-37]|uniref:endo alpha-1,4 polygalactosaminidase n=1 Tax=Umezawaea sp. Da 62-37 TaxID=3075927 RepID=UPI0028F726E7|nr:endo alpha-1,4 polygalactosaminidase [Umezawaea sp. Da 62-37]WNV87545.1 endo alpha-1,4 polygalactosaminidase [Umezawaea sp. Da 62-37]